MSPALVTPQRVDVAVIGGGIVGCAAAAMLADRGASVALIEATAIAAGASGRNLGAIQHPFDPVLAPLYRESIVRYAALADATDGRFTMLRAPVGLLLLNHDGDAAAAQAARIAATLPELRPQLMSPAEVVADEPLLRMGPAAVRVATGYPIPPASATSAWADLAEQRGADLLVGARARPDVVDGAAVGVVLDDGSRIAAGAVLVAAGPWAPELVDPTGRWRPIHSTWGVTLQLRLGPEAPWHILEEDAVDGVNRSAAATLRAAQPSGAEEDPPSLFSLASAAGISTLGSTFLPAEPDAGRIMPLLLRRAAAFMPTIIEARVMEHRLCARPQSIDGRPFIGPVAGVAGLHVCSGHGPWGISTGPASAALAARAILDGTDPPAELAADRPV